MVFATSITLKLFEDLPNYKKILNEKMPEFVLQNGVLSVNEQKGFAISDDIFVFFVSDAQSNVTKEEIFAMSNQKYDYYVLVYNDRMRIYLNQDSNILPISEYLLNNFPNGNKFSFINFLDSFSKSYTNRLVIIGVLTCSIFIIYGIYRLWLVLMFLLSICFFNVIFLMKLKFSGYLKVAIYVSSLPILLEMLAFSINNALPKGASIITVIISLVYIFYALRAIKLTSILSVVEGRTPEEKIRNAIRKAHEELEKQMKEIDEEAKMREETKNKNDSEEQENKEDKEDKENKE